MAQSIKFIFAFVGEEVAVVVVAAAFICGSGGGGDGGWIFAGRWGSFAVVFVSNPISIEAI